VNIMKAAGVEPDTQKIKMLVSALSEVNIDQALSAQLIAAPTAAAAQLSKPGEKPKEEAKAEEKEEVAGLGALFE